MSAVPTKTIGPLTMAPWRPSTYLSTRDVPQLLASSSRHARHHRRAGAPLPLRRARHRAAGRYGMRATDAARIPSRSPRYKSQNSALLSSSGDLSDVVSLFLRAIPTAQVNRGKRFRFGPCLRLSLALARGASALTRSGELPATSAHVVPVGESQGDRVFRRA